jgi:adenylate cyclase
MTNMVENSNPSIQIDLNEFKLHLHFKNKTPLTLHFNTLSRKFYLSLIALVVYEMKNAGKIRTISMQDHFDLLVLLNESIGGFAGSSNRASLFRRIYTKWKDALPNLEEAPLFKVLGRKKGEADGSFGKVYSFTDAEKDGWANLFEYIGSEENVRLKFAVDKIGVGLDETSIIFGDYQNAEAWEEFIVGLKKDQAEKKEPEEDVVPEEPADASPPLKIKTIGVSRYRWAILVLVIGAAAAGLIWKFYLQPGPEPVAALNRMHYPLPDQPSIAVLPFVNLSGDPKQEFICDGMSDEIITALTRIPRLFVIARNSTFAYKGKPVKIKQVSEELGVRYVLEGSMQRTGDRIRINAQLIDALTGHHLWAERYDHDLKDLFAMQDEITRKILWAVEANLTGFKSSYTVTPVQKYYRGSNGLNCYLKVLEAYGLYLRMNREDNILARRISEEVLDLCPDNPYVYVNLGWVYFFDFVTGNTKSPRETLEKGLELGQKALALDDSVGAAHALMSALYSGKGEHEKAIAEGERGVALVPNGWVVLCNYANSLAYAGRPEEAIPLYQKAIRLNPLGPVFYHSNLAQALRMTGRFEESVSAYKKAIQLARDNYFFHSGLVVTYSMMGREKEARAEAAEVLRLNPKFSVDSWAKSSRFKDQSETDKVVAAWRKAGLK